MLKDKRFYRAFFALTFSIALQNLLTYSVNLADNVMVGAYSEVALSGTGLCNQIQFLLQMLVVGAGEGAVVLGSQYWGKGKIEVIPNIIGIALRFGLVMAALMFGVALLAPEWLLGLLTNEAAVIAEGARYLRVVCFTYLIFGITHILVASLRSIGIVRIGYVISFSSLIINIILNYCLIYGNFGFPELGVQGAAAATLVSRIVEMLIVFWFLKYREDKLNLTAKKLIFIDTSFLKDYTRVSLPVLVSQGQWGIAQMVQTGILGHMGQPAIAANFIATVLFQIISVVCYGSASASGILMGRTVGEGAGLDRIKPMVHTLQTLFLAIGVCSGVLLFAIRGPVLMLYELSPESKTLALQFMTILSITVVGTAYQMSSDTGIIRGGGDTKFSGLLNLFSMWLIVVPFSALAAFVLDQPPVVVFFLLKWDQLYKAIPVTIHIHRWKWVKRVARDSAPAQT